MSGASRTRLMALFVALALPLASLMPSAAWAQLNIQDNFTGASSSFDWKSFNGACLTAGDGTGTIPKCMGLPYYGGETLVGGTSGALPDAAGSGALRFTNGYPKGYHQNGAVVSNFTFPTGQGLQVTFTTVTYRGDSGGSGKDGADGISFFLMDGSQPPGIGAWGGSLAYSCTNTNTPRDGLVGGYLGLGIDEYGNFLNQGDNTASGFGYKWNRIGLRGAGSIAWSWLNTNYPLLYPSTLTAAQQQDAVWNTCKTGYLWDYSGVVASIPTAVQTSTTVMDYPAIAGAYKVLPSSIQIAKESAMKRGQAVPITYSLKITQNGLLSLAYSYNGGASQSVISGQNITTGNGPLPASFRFGFAGSTGGSSNIHEVLCFKATPYQQSSSSAGLNQQQSAQIQTSTQVYFAYYDPTNWSGSLTSRNLLYNTSTQSISFSPLANWDASCVLTGLAPGQICSATGVNSMTAQAPTDRTILSWDGTKGIPLEWSNLTSAQQTALDQDDASPIGANRLNYLRGDRSNEINSAGVGLYRARASVLGDIIDSSPTWVGWPAKSYGATWKDRLNASASLPENSGQTYTQYASANQQRLNVVYSGANDGLLHGFEAGSYTNQTTYNPALNDGKEVLAYMPGAVLQSAALSSAAGGCVNADNTETQVQSIHGSTPAVGANPACSNSTLDYSNTQYGHNFFVDATPGSGDLFYGGKWHTWLVGGMGPGGAAIYALDVTNPGNFSEGNAASLVVGEWTPSTISCANVSSCGANLGNTYGTPQIKRFHNGSWGAVFGNGFGSSSGDAGIYVMAVGSGGAQTFYYLSTGKSGTGDGIAFVTPVDLDGDNIIDFLYAGDLKGNIWRFDVTNSDPTKWAASTTPLFTTPAAQPITSAVVAAFSRQDPNLPRVIIDFGTGRQIPLTNTSPATYASGSQYLFGIWDWNMAAWNTKSPASQFASLPGPIAIGTTNMQAQAVQSVVTSAGGINYRTVTTNPVCWSGSTVCGSGNTKYGWYLPLGGSSEQVIYNPVISQGTLLVNTTIPATNTPLSCTASTATGWTMGISPSTGGAFTSSDFGDTATSFVNYTVSGNIQIVAGVALSGTGSVSVVTAAGNSFIVTQTSGTNSSGATAGSSGATSAFSGQPVHGSRWTWLEKR